MIVLILLWEENKYTERTVVTQQVTAPLQESMVLRPLHVAKLLSAIYVSSHLACVSANPLSMVRYGGYVKRTFMPDSLPDVEADVDFSAGTMKPAPAY